jgi:multiple sugar transport system permease protein
MAATTRAHRIGGATGRGAVVAVLIFWSLAPVLWNVMTSLKSRRDIFAYPPKLFFIPDFSSYQSLLSPENSSVRESIVNSVVVAIVSTSLIIVVASLAAYALSRFQFRFSGAMFSGFLSTRLLPPIVAVLPLYVLATTAGLIDTRTTLIIVYVALNLPLAIWLLRQYFESIPAEIEEAAQTDGASRVRVLRSVTLPLAAPGVVAVAILMFVECWNEFMFALIFTDSYARTLPVLLAEGEGELVTDFQGIAALATIQMIPVFLLALFTQRFLVKGLTAGAVK